MLLRNISDFSIFPQIPSLTTIIHTPNQKKKKERKKKRKQKRKNEYKTHKLSHKNDKPVWS